MKKRQSAVRGEVKWHGEERKTTTMGMIQREGRKKKEKKNNLWPRTALLRGRWGGRGGRRPRARQAQLSFGFALARAHFPE